MKPALATTAILSIVVTVTRRPVRIVAFSEVVLTQLAAIFLLALTMAAVWQGPPVRCRLT